MLSLADREGRELERDVETYCRIASASGSILSVGDLAQLVQVQATEAELEDAIRTNPLLNSNLLLNSGYVMRRSQGLGPEIVRDAVLEQEEGKRRALANLTAAREFASSLGKRAGLVAVGGTTSYLSAKEGDDIDLFCIARRGSMWVFMLESLVKARLFRLLRGGTPQLCLSFIMDEGWVETEFPAEKDAIFARDVLTSKVLKGPELYRESLQSATWMGRFFPKLYRTRLGSSPARGAGAERGAGRGPWAERAANAFLYATLGSYILLKAWLLNRRFAKEGLTDRLFTTDLGPDHCVYESNRYKKIRRMYAAIRAA